MFSQILISNDSTQITYKCSGDSASEISNILLLELDYVISTFFNVDEFDYELEKM